MEIVKKIFTDTIYVATKILEAITGHNSDLKAHQDIRAETTELGNQITVLMDEVEKTGWSVEGAKKIIPNALFVGGDYNTGKWGCIEGQTTNLPPSVTIGVRETIAYDTNNVTIRITEIRPIRGRVWQNTWDGVTWSGWEDRVGTLETGRGYLYPNILVSADVFKRNGVYSKWGSNTEPFAYCNIFSMTGADGRYATEIAIEGSGGQQMKIRGGNILDTPNASWTSIATTDKINISLLNGWVVEFGETIINKNGDECSMTLAVKNGQTSNGSTLFNITNDSFKPKLFTTLCSQYSYSYINVPINIDINGNVHLANSISTNERLLLNLKWSV